MAIPGIKRVSYLEENISAGIIELTREEVAQTGAVFPQGSTAGPRYADMTSVNI